MLFNRPSVRRCSVDLQPRLQQCSQTVAFQETRMVLSILLKVRRKTVGMSVVSVTVHRRLFVVRTVYWALITVPADEVILMSAFTAGYPSIVAVLMARNSRESSHIRPERPLSVLMTNRGTMRAGSACRTRCRW
jgi:hypothetical protein